MAGRVYSVPFINLGLSTNKQDLWALTTSSTVPATIEEIRLDPCATSVSEFAISLSLFTSTYTAGSGGSSATVAKRNPNEAAASSSCKLQNTTQTVVNTGAKLVMDAGMWNLVNGWYWQPISPDHNIIMPVSSCFVVSLDSTPASQNVSGCLIFREQP